MIELQIIQPFEIKSRLSRYRASSIEYRVSITKIGNIYFQASTVKGRYDVTRCLMKPNPFLQEAGNLLNQMREIRRDVHQHPELGTREVRTSRIVADYLKHLGLEVRTGVGGFGGVGLLSTRQTGRCVALRADMDALPMGEKITVPYASVKRGVAHCCGHDGHTAILLGAANLLCKFSDALEGNVKFLFQPSEDRAPGGAIPMIADGVLRDPDVDGIFSLHLCPDLAQGAVGIKSGFSTISSDVRHRRFCPFRIKTNTYTFP